MSNTSKAKNGNRSKRSEGLIPIATAAFHASFLIDRYFKGSPAAIAFLLRTPLDFLRMTFHVLEARVRWHLGEEQLVCYALFLEAVAASLLSRKLCTTAQSGFSKTSFSQKSMYSPSGS